MLGSKKPIAGWGHKYSAIQLNDALQNNRNEFLELCRRVTCDEKAANQLIQLIEKILDEKYNSEGDTELDASLLKSLRLKIDFPRTNGCTLIDFDENTKDFSYLEKETNLIQLLAHVHMLSLAKSGRKTL